MSGRRMSVIVALVLVGTVVAAVLPSASREVVARSAILIAGTWISWVLLSRLRASTASRPGRFDELRARSTRPPQELPGLGAIEAALRMSMSHALGVEILLGRLLRDLARWRLKRNRGIDLEADPDGARRVSGEALWRLIAPAGPATTGGSRIPGPALAAAIDDLERI